MKPILLYLLLLSLLFSSCKMIFKQPEIKQIHDIRVLDFTPDHISVKVSLELNNPNKYALKLDKLDLEILNRDRLRIGFANLEKEIIIPGRKSNTIDFSVRIDTRAAIKLISNSKQSVFLYIGGNGSGKVKGFTKSFSFEESVDLDVKSHLQNLIPKFSGGGQELFRVMNASIDNVNLGETTVRIEFMLLNPFGLSFRFNDFPAEIYIGEKLAGKGSLLSPLIFDENTFYRDGVLIFRMNNLKSIVSAAKGVIKGEIEYEVRGKVQINTLGMNIDNPYSFRDRFPVSISRLILGL